jgi:hypothetical protein
MFYRENGQFKTSYRADQQIFPIAQDRWAVLLIIAAAFLGGAAVQQRLHVPRHSDPVSDHVAGCPWGECAGGLLWPDFLGFGRLHGRGCLRRVQFLCAVCLGCP